MKSILSFIILLLTLSQLRAQDCSQLVVHDTASVCQEQSYDLLIAGKFDKWIDNDGWITEKVIKGYTVDMHKLNKDGDDIHYQLYSTRDQSRLYLSLSVTYPYFADKMTRTKNKYEIKFADGTLYKYDQPFSVTCDGDFYILLKGKARQLHWDADETKVEHVTPVYGDTVLLKKMQEVPVRVITKYSAWRNSKYMQKQTGKEFDDYHVEHELILPQSEAIKFMQSLQCLVKEQY